MIAAIATAVLAVVAGAVTAGVRGDDQGSDPVGTSPAPDSSAPDSSVPDLSVPDSPDATTSTTVPASTTMPTSTSVQTSTTVTTSTTVPTSTTIDDGLVPRADLDVATANASGVGGVAGAAAERLVAIGYTTVSAVNSLSLEETSVVYYQPELLDEAVRLALDLGWAPEAVAPVDEMPELDEPQLFQLVAVIGTDQA
jgi:hypothetical protein